MKTVRVINLREESPCICKRLRKEAAQAATSGEIGLSDLESLLCHVDEWHKAGHRVDDGKPVYRGHPSSQGVVKK
jgi:hypothetical protein